MTQGIFLIQADGSLVELHEEDYDSESLLQELLAKFPNLLSGNKSYKNQPVKWLLIRREMGVPDGEFLGDRWSVDHLFLDQEGVPTLVEVKRSADTRIRREVVGQMLDYAANATAYWPLEKIQTELETKAVEIGLELDILIQQFIGEDEDISDYWQRVKANLISGRVRLVFVADKIPRELKRIIEFLNQQMSPAEVYGIEVKQFTGQGIKSLVPQIVGVTAEADIRKTPGTNKKQWDKESFLAKLIERPNKRELEVANEILDWSDHNNLRIWWGTGSVDGSYYPFLDNDDKSHYTIAVRQGWKYAYLQIQFAQMIEPFDSNEMRQELADKIQKATGVRFDNEALSKYPSLKLSVLNQQKLQGFLETFDWYLEKCRSHDKQL